MWYNRVTTDMSILPEFMAHFESEMGYFRNECKISGNVEKNLAALPGTTEVRFSQLQEIEALLSYLELQLRKTRRKYFQKYLEHYTRALSSRDAEKYVDGEDEVIDYETLINEVALLRNKFIGGMKALESKNYMIGHIVRLRTARMEDISV